MYARFEVAWQILYIQSLIYYSTIYIAVQYYSFYMEALKNAMWNNVTFL